MISAHGVSVTYRNGVCALRPTDIRFGGGEMVVLLGPSGAGKSTLLRCLNGLVRPTQGTVEVEGIGPLGGPRALRLHRRRTGMIFQHHHLIGRLTALDNVLTGRLGFHSAWRSLLPLPAADTRVALDCLDRVGLADRALDRVDHLSGGQRQRVGIARALCQRPSLVLADEPVASLDPAAAQSILGDLRAICRADGITAIVSLHQVELARRFADRIVGLAQGRVVFDAPAPTLQGDAVTHIYGSAVELAA